MDTNKKDMSRRNAVRKVFQGAGFLGIGGLMWGGFIDKAKASDLTLRPPGAIDEKDFIKSCIKCGTCVEACPYESLNLAKPEDDVPIGTPYFEPREIPCYMCPDIPCVPVCPTGALDIKSVTTQNQETKEEKLDINKSKMGIAVVDTESCVAYWGIQCDACYRACPLLDEAITLVYEKNERTGKHAYLKPVIHNEICTGCGMCEHACITEKSAIFVLPVDIATGAVGNHYIKGWDKDDEKRVKDAKENESEETDGAMDYLNNWEDLLDEER